MRDSLATYCEPRNGGPSGVRVRRTKVFVVEVGIAVRNICGARDAFNPVASSASGGNDPSGRKFSADAKVKLAGASELS